MSKVTVQKVKDAGMAAAAFAELSITWDDLSWGCNHRAGLGTVPTVLSRCASSWFHIRAHWPGLEIAPCAVDYVELKGFKAQDVLR